MQSENTVVRKGVIFDMDGVISDTQDLHAQVESKMLQSVGINLLPDDITNRFAGVAKSTLSVPDSN